MADPTCRQRFEAALHRGAADRVPVFLRDLTLGLDVAGYSTPEVCAGTFDGVKSSRAVIAAQRELGHDAVVGSIQFCGLEVEPLGGRVHYPERGIPTVVEPPFRTPEDVERADLPDPESTFPLKGVLRAYELTSESVGKEVAVVGNIEGGMTRAGILRGLESFLMDLVLDPPLAKKIVEFSTAMGCELIAAMAAHGASSSIFVAAASDNPALIGHEAFRSGSLPSLRRFVDKARENELPTIFHPHGPFTDPAFAPLVDASLEQGIVGFQFAEQNDFRRAKGEWGARTCILGGVDVSTTLLLGPEERVRSETCEYLRTCAPGGGYVLMCSCSVHRGIPLANLRTMIETNRREGCYRTGPIGRGI